MERLSTRISETLTPIKRGGLFVYPADGLAAIFEWADANGRQVEWVEAVMLAEHATQPSMEHSTERRFWETEPEFRVACYNLAHGLTELAERLGSSPTFEVGISN